MGRYLCVLTVMFAAVLATAASPALAAFPGQNGKILFDSFHDNGDRTSGR